MKTKYLFALLIILLSKISGAQQPSLPVEVLFADGKTFFARMKAKTSNELNAEFVHSGSLYSFNKNGIIISSSGNYSKGSRVKGIYYWQFSNNVAQNEFICPDGEMIGVQFPDGKIFYGIAEQVKQNYFHVLFLHSNNRYQFEKKEGNWVVKSRNAGTYPAGTVASGIYEFINKVSFCTSN